MIRNGEFEGAPLRSVRRRFGVSRGLHSLFGRDRRLVFGEGYQLMIYGGPRNGRRMLGQMYGKLLLLKLISGGRDVDRGGSRDEVVGDKLVHVVLGSMW